MSTLLVTTSETPERKELACFGLEDKNLCVAVLFEDGEAAHFTEDQTVERFRFKGAPHPAVVVVSLPAWMARPSIESSVRLAVGSGTNRHAFVRLHTGGYPVRDFDYYKTGRYRYGGDAQDGPHPGLILAAKFADEFCPWSLVGMDHGVCQVGRALLGDKQVLVSDIVRKLYDEQAVFRGALAMHQARWLRELPEEEKSSALSLAKWR